MHIAVAYLGVKKSAKKQLRNLVKQIRKRTDTHGGMSLTRLRWIKAYAHYVAQQHAVDRMPEILEDRRRRRRNGAGSVNNRPGRMVRPGPTPEAGSMSDADDPDGIAALLDAARCLRRGALDSAAWGSPMLADCSANG